MVMLVALVGTVMPGCTVKPSCVTIVPSLDSLNDPSRVYAVVPSGKSTWKKPRPLIATSSGLSVICRLPCSWIR
jgi:hypothetical protein